MIDNAPLRSDRTSMLPDEKGDNSKLLNSTWKLEKKKD
jgi:hypothetical protein